jgi:hypothetical protein
MQCSQLERRCQVSDTPRTDEQHAEFPMGGFTLDFARQLERELAEARDQLAGASKLMNACDVLVRDLAEARKERDTLAEALSMYGLPYTDDDLEHMAQNPSPQTEIGTHAVD